MEVIKHMASVCLGREGKEDGQGQGKWREGGISVEGVIALLEFVKHIPTHRRQ